VLSEYQFEVNKLVLVLTVNRFRRKKNLLVILST